MRGKCLMIQGTASSVGKSVLCAALLRILKQDGLRVAPFKAQNMALNSFVTKDGREMGRAQVTQAQAAGMEPDVRMNPVLLKPTGDRRSQVIIEGRAVGSMTAMEYHAYKPALRQRIKTIYDSLEREVDCVVIEGAGSPAEINLREGDIVNMSMAEAADAPVLLVGDIDLGGVYRVSDHSGGSMMFRLHMEALAAGFLLDLLLGDPEWLYHPVRLIGRYIAWMEKRLRQRGRNLRRSALWLTATTVLGTMAVVALILGLVGLWGRIPLFIAMALLDWMGIAVTSMAKEARAVGRALPRGIFAARKQVSRIVGRDTQYLSEREIICATVETVAENTTDGVISPMFYAFLGGPILLWGFKAASTLDSMVGYMNEKYRDIGWSSARLDDILNYLPARLTAGLMVCAAFLTGLDGRNAARIVWRDHANHSSPNCAWSEAAAAGALHIRLGGTHNYFGKPVYKPTIGDADRPPQRQDIRRANRLLYVTSLLMMALLCLIFIISGGASI